MLAEHAVYTIIHPDELSSFIGSNRPKELSETKRWVTARTLFNAAQDQGLGMAIVFGDATHCSNLKYWGLLSSLTVDQDGTAYGVTHLRTLRGKRTQQLILRSTNRHIAEGFIRPYAIVQRPSFARVDSASGNVLPSSRRPHAHTTKRLDAGVTMFSFGYWGAGSATRELVEAIDAAEMLRGFEPPLWVDIRISRSVRAAGFRDTEFQQLLKTRYVGFQISETCAFRRNEGGFRSRTRLPQ